MNNLFLIKGNIIKNTITVSNLVIAKIPYLRWFVDTF